jgi:hypothetical protein
MVALLSLVLIGVSVSAATSGLAATATTASASATTLAVSGTAFAIQSAFLALTVLLDFRLVDRLLIADIFLVELLLAQHDFEHRHHARELQVVQTLLKRLVLVHNRNVADFAQLVKTLDAVLDQLSQFDGALNSV